MSKKLCLYCRESFNLSPESSRNSNFKCPQCGKEAIVVTHRFRPPKVDGIRKWDVVEFLIDNGFSYQHIEIHEPCRHGIERFVGYVQYPENMIDAIEFVEKYKSKI